MERNVSSPSLIWARNMIAAPQRAEQMDSAGVPPQRAMTRIGNMAFVPAEVCDRERINKCIVCQSMIVLTDFCDLEQIRLLSVGTLKESSAAFHLCSLAKSMIPAPVRAEQMANCGAVPLQTMIKTRNGACVPTEVRVASQ